MDSARDKTSALEPLARRPHLGLDLALPGTGRGLLVMDLPSGSPLEGRVSVGDRLLGIDGEPIDGLDRVRNLVRCMPVGHCCVLDFDTGRIEQTLEPLPTEPIPGGRVELGEVDCGDCRLRAIWTFPDAAGPFPLVWLLPSANWLSEEHTQQLWHPTLKLVRALTARGFATLRVDRSGLGDSEGPPCVDTDLETELLWIREGHRQLFDHPAIDPSRWFLFGRSLGGTLVQLLAHELSPTAAAVWGATSIDWHEAMMRSARRQRTLAGTTEPALSTVLAKRRRLAEAVLVRRERARDVLLREPDLEEVAKDFRGGRVHGRVARFFQQLQARDVAADCGRYEGPMLVMRGELDWLTSMEDAASVVAAARRPTFRRFEGVDHLMHRRPSLEEAFEHVFGGDFDDCGAVAMDAFFRGAE